MNLSRYLVSQLPVGGVRCPNHCVCVCVCCSDSATLYLLRLPAAVELYAECARLGATHGHHAPAMCLSLLEEAHMVLRPAVRWQLGPPPDHQLAQQYASSAAGIGYFLLRYAAVG